MKIKEAVWKTGKTDNNVIKVRAATNNISKKTTQDLSKDVLDTLNEIQQNNPQSKIAYSAVFRRKDSHELNAKVTQSNILLAEELPLYGFDIIDNSNMLFSNLKQDGLHLNSGGGVRKFAGNVIKFSKYCQRGLSSNSHIHKSKVLGSRKRNGLKIAFLSIVSLRKYKDELGVILHDNDIDIIGLSETRLDKNIKDFELAIEGYKILRHDRDANGGSCNLCQRFPTRTHN